MNKPGKNPASETQIGGIYALIAFGIWAGFPIYFKAVSAVPALEILAHRICWTLIFVACVLLTLGKWKSISTVFRDRRLFKLLCLSSLFVTINWLTFIWAITNDHVLDSSLGYFINPLVNVVLGVLFLQERLRAPQWGAVGLAAIGVGNLVVQHGQFPWIALTVAFTFAFYGLIRKQTAVNPFTGLFVETSLVLPFALAYLGYVAYAGIQSFGTMGTTMDILLLISGVLTALPLLLFAGAARRLRLSTLGLFQYTVPTGHFLLAVFAYGEPFTRAHMFTFGCIWLALIIYAVDGYRAERRRVDGATAAR